VLQNLVEKKLNEEQQDLQHSNYSSGDDSEEDFTEMNLGHSGGDILNDRLNEYKTFINALPECTVLMFGLCVKAKDHSDGWCYCPCGQKMSIWRQQFNLEGILQEHPADQCQSRKRPSKSFQPQALKDHLKAKQEWHGDGPATLHWIVEQYILLLGL
jgi:hypothetical protein